MKKILVTGGLGYIGSHTVVELVKEGYEPIIIDDFSNSEKSILPRVEKLAGKTLAVYEGDCADLPLMERIFTEHKIEGVIHFAAFKAVGESMELPMKYYDNNINSLLTVLKCMQKFDVETIVFSSSCTVYGSPEVSTCVYESTPSGSPTSPYGWSKLMCEQIMNSIINASNIKAVYLRYFNPIGAHPSGELGELPLGRPNNVVPFITQTMIGIRESLTVFGDDYPTPDGTCIRDYIHVMDIADAHILALSYKTDNNPEVFNLGTGKGSSVLELITEFEEVLGSKINWHFGPRRAGDVPEIYANTDKVTKELGWIPKFTIKQALADAWRWEENRNSK